MKAKANQLPKNKENAVRARPKDSHQATHPLIQLQRTIGNRAVTNLLQRHPKSKMERYGFHVTDSEDGQDKTLYS